MPKSLRASIIWLACTLSFTACQDSLLFHQYSSVEREGWRSDSPATFLVKDSTDGIDLQVCIELRHTKEYKFKNITLVATAETEEHTVWADTVSMELFKDNGKKTGTGMPYISNQIRAKDISLEKNQIYTFKIKHIMRCDPLEGVTDIGIKISKPDLQKY